MSNEVLTLDEVVARNVRRLRFNRGYSIAQLADRLQVGRHASYDYERPRKDSSQHAFKWSELVRLCAALECSLFDLVLPPEDVSLDLPDWVAPPSHVQAIALGEELGAVEVTPPGREEISQVVFHLPADVVVNLTHPEWFEKWKQRSAEAIREALREAQKSMFEELRRAQRGEEK